MPSRWSVISRQAIHESWKKKEKWKQTKTASIEFESELSKLSECHQTGRSKTDLQTSKIK